MLLEGLSLPYAAQVPLGGLTWYGVGGAADLMVHPRSIEDLAAVSRRCSEAGVKLYTLGSGANLLVTDEGVRGVVVRLDGPAFTQMSASSRGIRAGAGVDLAKLILETAKDGLSGLEVLAGIPASIGGAVQMNCGGKYGQIGDCVGSLKALGPKGEVEELGRDRLEFGYRRSNLAERIVVEVSFELEPGDPVALRERVKEIFAWKKSTQPLADRSAGCAFKNPKSQSEKGAGQLIDEAGLKGFKVGGAEVSHRHANFLVVHPGGTANDVIRLIRAVKKRVAEHCGVQLEEEVVIWGHSPLEP